MPHDNGNGSMAICVECEIPQLARNNYFNGKLLVERHFTDEQRYQLGKLRRHNQRLHGWGVACGLKVKQHPNEACRDKWLVVDPGVAIDCCGREILVSREQYVRYDELLPDSVRHEDATASSHRLQLCLRYVECPTEEVPILFDECVDDDACVPDRILESFAFDVLVDSAQPPPAAAGATLTWASTINLARTQRAAVDEAKGRAYVLAGDGPGTLLAFALDNLNLVAAASVVNTPKDVATAPDGQLIYVATATPAGDLDLHVLDADAISADPSSTVTVPGAGEGLVRLEVAPDGRLYALASNQAGSDAKLYAWDDVTGGGAPEETAAFGVGATGLAVSPTGDDVLVGVTDAANEVRIVKASDLSVASAHTGIAATALATTDTTGGMRAYVADRDGQTVAAFEFKPGDAQPLQPLGQPVSVAPNRPVDVTASAGGQWLYLLLDDGDAEGKAYVQAVEGHKLEAGTTGALGSEVEVGTAGRELLLATGDNRLYAPFHGAPDDDTSGGVAIVGATERDCASLFTSTLDSCPACADGNCVVLATIDDYNLGQSIGDSRIDNLADRRLLPSTEVITEVVRCLLEHPAGSGERGPQGPPGRSVTTATAESIDPPTDPSVELRSGGTELLFKLPRFGNPTAESVPPDEDAAVELRPGGELHFKVPRGAAGEGDGGVASVSSEAIDTPADPSVELRAGGEIHFKLPRIRSASAEAVDPDQQPQVTMAANGDLHFKIPRGQGITAVTSEAVNTPADPSVELQGGDTIHFKLPRFASASVTSIAADQPAQVTMQPDGDLHFDLPRGEKGDPGKGIDTVSSTRIDPPNDPQVALQGADLHFQLPAFTGATAEAVDPPTTAGVQIQPGGILHFLIPRGAPGRDAADVALKLPHIVAINWPHNGFVDSQGFVLDESQQRIDGPDGNPLTLQQGVVVAFDQEMMAETVTWHTFELLVARPTRDPGAPMFSLFQYVNIRGNVSGFRQPGDWIADCANGIGSPIPKPNGDVTDGGIVAARFLPKSDFPWPAGTYEVRLHGSQVLANEPIQVGDEPEFYPAVDADYVAPGPLGPGGVPPRPGMTKRCPTGNRTEGGLFRSWFTVVNAG
jgi:hypothetical protein